MLSKAGIWLTSRPGKRFVNRAVAVLTGGVVCLNYVPQTLLLEKYTEIYYSYKSGFKAKLPDDLIEKFNQCLEILKIQSFYKKKIEPFPVFGFDLFHAGSFDTRNGVTIGIPQTYSYSHKDDIDKDIIQVNLKPVDWSSEAGEKLAESLILTEKEKQFGICREILMTNTMQIILDAVIPAVSIILVYMINTSANQNLQLFKRPSPIRYTLYGITSLFGFGIYCFFTDFTQVQYEHNTDEQLCNLGPDFIEAGVGFYTKMLNRNVALRSLMGQNGENIYTALGNESSLIRYKNLPLTLRKSYFEQKLKELTEEEADKTQPEQ